MVLILLQVQILMVPPREITDTADKSGESSNSDGEF